MASGQNIATAKGALAGAEQGAASGNWIGSVIGALTGASSGALGADTAINGGAGAGNATATPAPAVFSYQWLAEPDHLAIVGGVACVLVLVGFAIYAGVL